MAAGHALVVLLVVTSQRNATGGSGVRERTSTPLLWIVSPPQSATRPSEPATPRRARTRRSPAEAPADAPPGARPVAPVPAAPRIDWQREAERVGRSGATLLLPDTRRCDDSGRPGSMLPRCTPRIEPFEWDPEPNLINFSGGLPYIHVGKMCVVGLGFFACGLGTPPPANAHLFDEMKNPDRPRGSVPGNH